MTRPSPTLQSRIGWAAIAPLVFVLAACADEPLFGPRPEATGDSPAYDVWRPGPNDTCTPEIHNRYSTAGPDALRYPTWHPPVDPETGCSFGHEHGRNPRGSDLYSTVGDIPFGYALPADHVGYKIEWENDVEFHFSGEAASSLFDVRCDVMTELHQGSHGPGAFRINTHELVFHMNCSDGARVHLTLISLIGKAGAFVTSCDRRTVVIETPGEEARDGGGIRLIPDRECVVERLLVPEGETSNFGGLRESWEIGDGIRTREGHRLVSINPYFQVLLPSRYYDPDQPATVGRPIDLCLAERTDGLRARGELCALSTDEGTLTNVTYDDPRSEFRGARRFVDVNSVRIDNADGPEVWYTDKYGDNARRKPFPGAIRQIVSAVDNERANQPSGPAIGRDRNYGERGVHPPN